MSGSEQGRATTDRERRLWIWTAVAVAGVYASLGLSSILVELLHDQTAAAIAFLAAMFLIGVMVLSQGLRVRPGGVEVGIILGIVVVFVMAFFRMGMPERSHLVEFGVVAVLFYEALTERAASRHVPRPWLLAIALTSLVGVIDEAVQILLPSRVFDPADILFNVLVATSVVAAMALLRWARRKFGRGTATSDRARSGTASASNGRTTSRRPSRKS